MIRQAVVLAFVGGLVGLSAQAPAPAPGELAFEVASVKPNVSGDGGASWVAPPRGIVRITNAPLGAIITRAYGIPFALERWLFDVLVIDSVQQPTPD